MPVAGRFALWSASWLALALAGCRNGADPTAVAVPVSSETPNELPLVESPLATAGPVATPTETNPAPPNTFHLKDVTIQMERSPCFGFCPEYTVTVSGEGHVAFNGIANVEVKGPHEAQIDGEAVEDLLKSIFENDFFAMRDRYDSKPTITVNDDGTVDVLTSSITDVPTTIVTVRIGAFTKSVIDYYEAPGGLHAIERKIDEKSGILDRIGGWP